MSSLLLALNFTRFDSSFMNANAHEARPGKRANVAHARLFILAQHGPLSPPDAAFTLSLPPRLVLLTDYTCLQAAIATGRMNLNGTWKKKFCAIVPSSASSFWLLIG